MVSRDPATLAEYGKDWTKVYAPAPSAILFPKNTADVALALKACDAHSLAVVPSGGRTGLAGGAVAAKGEVVLSLSRMRRMDPVDLLGGTVRVEAGAVTQAVHEHCAPHGLTWPVDFASKGSSHVGGNIATNAGGVKVIRYGLTRQWVLGLQVVLADGSILEIGGAHGGPLEKNNTGIDLRQLFIGSEGILGVITEATLKLVRVPEKLEVFLFAVSDLDAVLSLFAAVRERGLHLMAYEFFTDRCLKRLLSHRKLREPFAERSSHYVLLEIERQTTDVDKFIHEIFESGLVRDGVVAQSSQQAQELWALREGISESLSATGLPHKNDVALPIKGLRGFCSELDALFAAQYPDFEICLFGHIGDGNLHVNVMKPEGMEKTAFLQATKAADRHMFELVQKYEGSVSAEHGIGLLKKDALHYTRTAEQIEIMRGIKRVLDPKGLMNPGKIF